MSLKTPNLGEFLTSRFNGTWFKTNQPIPNSFKQVNPEGEDMTANATATLTQEQQKIVEGVTHTTNNLEADKLSAGVINLNDFDKPFIQDGEYTEEFIESFKEALRYLKEVTLMGLVASGQINQKSQENKQQAIALIHEELKEFFEAKRDSDIVDALVDTIVTDMGKKLRFGGYENSTYVDFSPVPYLKGFVGTENDEVKELKDVLLDYEGFLDFSALNLLCKYGWKSIEAIRLIANNNASKFPSANHPDIDRIIQDTIRQYADKGVVITPVYNKEYNCYAFMDEAQKYRKPHNFKSVDQKMQELFPDPLPQWYLDCVKETKVNEGVDEMKSNEVANQEDICCEVTGLGVLASVNLPDNYGEILPVPYTETTQKIKSDGGSSKYYEVEIIRASDGAKFKCETKDIYYALVGGDSDLSNVIKATRRMYLDAIGGGKEGIDGEYDANKIKFFVEDFVKRAEYKQVK